MMYFGIVTITLGTAQDPEKIEYKGETSDLYTNPLESKLEGLHVLYGEKYTSGDSGNWRGYIGHWKIEDEFLFLTDVQARGWVKKDSGDTRISGPVSLKDILGTGKAYPVKADWYSGTLRIPRGEIAGDVNMGYGSRFKEELYIEVKAGKVVKEYSVKYDPAKDAFRSRADMQWVALGGLTASKDNGGNWIDGRLLYAASIARLIESKKVFKTRGILFSDGKLPHLWIPVTLKTKSISLPISKLTKPQIPEGSHVEIECKFYEMEDGGFGLEATSMRVLQPRETIHHLQYPEIWKMMERFIGTPRVTKEAEQGSTDQPATSVELKLEKTTPTVVSQTEEMIDSLTSSNKVNNWPRMGPLRSWRMSVNTYVHNLESVAIRDLYYRTCKKLDALYGGLVTTYRWADKMRDNGLKI